MGTENQNDERKQEDTKPAGQTAKDEEAGNDFWRKCLSRLVRMTTGKIYMFNTGLSIIMVLWPVTTPRLKKYMRMGRKR